MRLPDRRILMKLKKWFKRQKDLGKPVSKAEFARSCGVSAPTVFNWLKGGIPDKDTMPLIKKATEGEVTPNDFY